MISTRDVWSFRAPTLPLFLVFAALAACQDAARAQPYPAKPIKLVVPSPPGGGTDTLARVVANKLRETVQWQVVVENRPGAGGNIGMDAAAKSAADGYTLVMGESSNLTINPYLYAKMTFDPAKDLASVVLVGTVPLVLVATPARQLDTVAAVVAAAKERSLTFASGGNGTVGHLAGEIWMRQAGITLRHIPYRGGAPAIADLLGGQVDLSFASIPAAGSLIQAGSLRALAVTSPKRTSQLPDVPTLDEAGFKVFSAQVIYGVLVPTGTPADIVQRLNLEINRALQSDDTQASLAKVGVDVRGGTAAEFDAVLTSERAKWSRAVADSGATVD